MTTLYDDPPEAWAKPCDVPAPANRTTGGVPMFRKLIIAAMAIAGIGAAAAPAVMSVTASASPPPAVLYHVDGPAAVLYHV